MNDILDNIEPTSRSSKPLCLSNLAAPILDIIKTKEITTFAEVADIIINDICKNKPEENKDRTLRRRVYDVLNVFCAAGFIEKNNKSIKFCYVPSPANQINSLNNEPEYRIREKEKILFSKIKQLIYHSLLLEKNQSRNRPHNAIKLPCIFVGFRDISSGTVNRSLDGKQLSIISSSAPFFFSPIDVFKKMNFSLIDQKKHIKYYPILNIIQDEIIKDLNNC